MKIRLAEMFADFRTRPEPVEEVTNWVDWRGMLIEAVRVATIEVLLTLDDRMMEHLPNLLSFLDDTAEEQLSMLEYAAEGFSLCGLSLWCDEVSEETVYLSIISGTLDVLYRVHATTAVLVDGNWLAIERVAAVLMRQKAVAQSDVDRLIRSPQNRRQSVYCGTRSREFLQWSGSRFEASRECAEAVDEHEWDWFYEYVLGR